MFIKALTETRNEIDIALAFLKSKAVQAFPCSSRRSTFIGRDRDNDGEISGTEGYRIPFDPESRLNTEANNRKHSSLNGFTQTYLKDWDETNYWLTLSLAGYFFNIDTAGPIESFANNAFEKLLEEGLDHDMEVSQAAGKDYGTAERDQFITKFNNDHKKLYANILIKDAPLFSSKALSLSYNTSVLSVLHSLGESADESAIDLTIVPLSTDINDYYFSGLAFSVEPYAKHVRDEKTGSNSNFNIFDDFSFEGIDGNPKQRVVSLQLFERTNDNTSWKIYEPSRLPKIEHGNTVDSLVIGDTYAQSIETPNITVTDTANITNVTVTNKFTAKNSDITFNINDDKTFTTEIDTAKIDTAKIASAVVSNIKVPAVQADHIEVSDFANNGTGGWIKAQTFTQNDNPVPIIDLVEQPDTSWQLQISRIIVRPKSN